MLCCLRGMVVDERYAGRVGANGKMQPALQLPVGVLVVTVDAQGRRHKAQHSGTRGP